MKRHVLAWLFAAGFIWAGLSVAGCEPEDDRPKTQCIEKTKTGVKRC